MPARSRFTSSISCSRVSTSRSSSMISPPLGGLRTARYASKLGSARSEPPRLRAHGRTCSVHPLEEELGEELVRMYELGAAHLLEPSRERLRDDEVERGEIALELLELARADDGRAHPRARRDPRERHLGRRGAELASHGDELVHDRPVPFGEELVEPRVAVGRDGGKPTLAHGLHPVAPILA